MLRLCLLGILVVVLLIPTAMIRGLVLERQSRNDEATAEVSSKWGHKQIITGPVLVLPYVVAQTDTVKSVRNAIFLPKRLQTTGQVNAEERSRGVFVVPVYTATLTIEGEFARPNVADLGIEPASVLWDRAHLAVGISDVRAVREQAAISWNGSRTEFLPGTSGFADGGPGVHAPVAASAGDTGFKFSFPVSLNGSMGLYFVPFAEETVVQIQSNSRFPNFQGNWLPAERNISESGFNASWRVPYLGRDYAQAWISGAQVRQAIDQSRFGLELTRPIDQYRMAERSVKYAGLFILLTFAAIWLVEVVAGVHVHPIQYLMIGAALCVFYLLELSLSEHISFSLAYGIASLAILAMVAAYSRTVFRQGRRAAVVSTGVGLLYTYLFVLLTNEDGALLVGSIGLFAILAAIMFVTRGIDWYAGRNAEARS